MLGIPTGESRNSMLYRQAPSIFYVAASRVRNLESLAFSAPFQSEIVNCKSNKHFMQWSAEELRLAEMEAKGQ